jgi:colanic acid/amylovoran biosynthesis glycosyltransferase
MSRVLIFKETVLPRSETFILAQMKALTRYQPILAGLERARPSLPLEQEPLLLSKMGSTISAIRAKVYRRSGFAPLFHRELRSVRADLVHAHFASGGHTALHLLQSLRIPLIVTLHGSDVTVRGSKVDANKRLAERASLFLCVSEFIRERAIEAGFPPEKLQVHHIGIDRQVFSPPQSQAPRKGVLFVGRLVEKKGCEYLLRAMQSVQRVHPECELDIIGDGPLRPALEALARELRVSCNFRGAQPSDCVREALRQTSLFCAPSVTASNGDSEGLPTVIAEAQAMGVPVVASAHAGIPEIVGHGETGVLAPERDHAAIAEALILLLTDEDRWNRFHRAALNRIEQKFDLRKQTALLEEFYSRVSASS